MAAVDKQLLSRLTHHVRNPFNGIIGFSDLLANHFEKLSDEDKINYIHIVHQQSKKALLRSENLAWWLKFYTNNITAVAQKFDLADLIKDELNYFNNEIQKQHLDLMLDLDESAFVKTDRMILQGVIKNLLLNVIEFTPVAGYVQIITSNKFDENLVQLTITNVYAEKPSEETMMFIKNTDETVFNTMPDNPGLWTVKMLCGLLNINFSMDLKDDQVEVTLLINIA
ncbi:MAG: HAMP domain-containing histidine kinase [Bacteroidia bacterium]|nr:HAMP domain-containing histidine kinase [Bacteroidia bacterium]MBP9689276.1 HAMP domain-containing histidine kinase [Bacteroidia bacterium]